MYIYFYIYVKIKTIKKYIKRMTTIIKKLINSKKNTKIYIIDIYLIFIYNNFICSIFNKKIAIKIDNY